MKNPPTLADALIGLSFNKKIHKAAAAHLRAMLPARKFVLDDNMSRYLAELEMAFAGSGSHKKRLKMIDMLRREARLPHSLTWIEINTRAYREHTVKVHGLEIKPHLRTMLRRGYLLQQHPHIETAFKCFEYDAHRDMDDLTISHVGMAWCCNDTTPVPWKQYQHPAPWRQSSYGRASNNLAKMPGWQYGTPDDYEWSDSELLAGMSGYCTLQAYLISAVPQDIYGVLLEKQRTDIKYIWKWRSAARCLWTLLATINDLPTSFEHIEPSRGFVARGRYKRFLAHTIVHLSVPQEKWRKLSARALVALRRRAHQVRGHWRRDWRNPLSKACIHEFDDSMICQRCGGHKLWIPEHQRGDASLGFVTHDYAVHHEQD